MNRLRILILALVLGAFGGIGLYTFHYAEGFSYFSSDSRACINCHIMEPHFDAWQMASHHGVASCVDCHLPTNLVAKLIAKTDNGYRHSKGFTFQDFPEPIFISPQGAKIVQNNCIRCHEPMVHDLLSQGKSPDSLRCVHCHSTVGHGEKTGMGRYEKITLREENKK